MTLLYKYLLPSGNKVVGNVVPTYTYVKTSDATYPTNTPNGITFPNGSWDTNKTRTNYVYKMTPNTTYTLSRNWFFGAFSSPTGTYTIDPGAGSISAPANTVTTTDVVSSTYNANTGVFTYTCNAGVGSNTATKIDAITKHLNTMTLKTSSRDRSFVMVPNTSGAEYRFVSADDTLAYQFTFDNDFQFTANSVSLHPTGMFPGNGRGTNYDQPDLSEPSIVWDSGLGDNVYTWQIPPVYDGPNAAYSSQHRTPPANPTQRRQRQRISAPDWIGDGMTKMEVVNDFGLSLWGVRGGFRTITRQPSNGTSYKYLYRTDVSDTNDGKGGWSFLSRDWTIEANIYGWRGSIPIYFGYPSMLFRVACIPKNRVVNPSDRENFYEVYYNGTTLESFTKSQNLQFTHAGETLSSDYVTENTSYTPYGNQAGIRHDYVVVQKKGNQLSIWVNGVWGGTTACTNISSSAYPPTGSNLNLYFGNDIGYSATGDCYLHNVKIFRAAKYSPVAGTITVPAKPRCK